MRRITGSIFALSLLTAATACNNGDDSSGSKGVVDSDTLTEDGVTVRLNGDIGTVDVPFIAPVPSKPDDETLSESLQDAATLTVRSDVTGTTANLMDGEWVEEPSGPGEYNWSLNDSRDILTFTFYNETTAGTTLKTDRTYTGTMQIATNPYVENVASTAVAVSVSN